MRGASAIVTFAGLDAVDAKDRASRGARKTFACGRDGPLPDLPLAWGRLTFGWTNSGSRVTDDSLGGVWRLALASATRIQQHPEHRVRNAERCSASGKS